MSRYGDSFTGRLDRIWRDMIYSVFGRRGKISAIFRETIGPYAALSGSFLLLSLIFALIGRKTKSFVWRVVSIVCAVVSVIMAFVWRLLWIDAWHSHPIAEWFVVILVLCAAVAIGLLAFSGSNKKKQEQEKEQKTMEAEKETAYPDIQRESQVPVETEKEPMEIDQMMSINEGMDSHDSENLQKDSMNITFKGKMSSPWTLNGQTIVTGGKTIAISDVLAFENKPADTPMRNGVFQIKTRNGKDVFLAYGWSQNDDAAKAEAYIAQHMGGETTEQQKEVIRLRTGVEIRKRCKVCGYLMCYNYEDYMKNENLKKRIISERGFAALSALSVSTLQSSVMSGNANQMENQLKDFTRCPKCNSTDLVEVSDENPLVETTGTSSVSVPDEIRKYKALLDDGIITEEDFQAKKKQLLGL